MVVEVALVGDLVCLACVAWFASGSCVVLVVVVLAVFGTSGSSGGDVGSCGGGRGHGVGDGAAAVAALSVRVVSAADVVTVSPVGAAISMVVAEVVATCGGSGCRMLCGDGDVLLRR